MTFASHAAHVAIALGAIGTVGLILYDMFLSPDAEQASEDFRISEYLWEETVPPETPSPATALTRHDGTLDEAFSFI